jgi:4'-phosphopantetheinyl transferase EntD
MTDLAAALRAVLPEGVALGVAAPGEAGVDWPGEAMPHAVPHRLAEFRAGRLAARRAMQHLAVAPCAIPIGDDRAPIWPAGLVGSISHCDGACMAVVSRAGIWRGLGLDIEPDRALQPELWPTVLRPEEMRFCQANPDAALAIFVAKEAAYKAQYPRSLTLFDFQTLRIDFGAGGFEASFMKDIAGFPKGSRLGGKLLRTAGLCAALVASSWPKISIAE